MRRFGVVATFLLAAVFLYFTVPSVNQFFSGDDLTNTWEAWSLKPVRLVESLFLIGMPAYRPLGGVIYLLFYRFFGFHPQPLYVFSWLFLAGNAVLAWRLFRQLTGEVAVAFIALSLTLVHASMSPGLYDNAGAIYDRLWFFFTVLGVLTWARLRSRPNGLTWWSALLIVLISIAAMDSKESGLTLPALLVCYELTFVRRRWREVVPLFSVLAVLCLVFVFLRVERTEGLDSPSYARHLTFAVWMTRVGAYLGMLLYRAPLPDVALALLLVGMAAAALLLRNRVMIFGLLWFVVTITPIAAITPRPGYVLYVPEIGLGLFIAAGLAALLRTQPRLIAAFFVLTLALVEVHKSHWPPPRDSSHEPQFIFARQFLQEYPYGWPRGSRLLFARDGFAPDNYDFFFTLSLLYHDRTINIDRLDASPQQRPDPRHPAHYQRAFTYVDEHYFELDDRDLDESVRLNIFRNEIVGRKVKFHALNGAPYVVSGVLNTQPVNDGRWTTPHAELKFDVYPAPAIFSVRFVLAQAEGAEATRSLQVSVNGRVVGSTPLVGKDMTEVTFPVPADQITRNGFTLVNLDVSPAFKTAEGAELGILLFAAGFDYR